MLHADGPALDALTRIADDVRRSAVGDDVTYIVTRNINFTNVCYTGCRFCAFAQRRTDADAYTLSLDQVADRAQQAWDVGAVEVCMQGGIHPDLPGTAYFDIAKAVKERVHATPAGMVERDWNHPSIVIWTLVNESWGVDLAVNPEHRAWLAKMYDYLKRIDPYRLVVGNSACFTNFHVVTDIEDFHNYYSIPDHYDQWRDWVQTFATRPPWTCRRRCCARSARCRPR